MMDVVDGKRGRLRDMAGMMDYNAYGTGHRSDV